MRSDTVSMTLPTRLTQENANRAVRQLCGMIDTASNATACIDLSAVVHCDSAGLAALIEAKTYATSRQYTLIYQQPGQQLCALATFLKVKQLLFSGVDK